MRCCFLLDIFGTVECGGSFFWRGMKINFFYDFGARDGILGMLVAVLRPILSFESGNGAIT